MGMGNLRILLACVAGRVRRYPKGEGRPGFNPPAGLQLKTNKLKNRASVKIKSRGPKLMQKIEKIF